MDMVNDSLHLCFSQTFYLDPTYLVKSYGLMEFTEIVENTHIQTHEPPLKIKYK